MTEAHAGLSTAAVSLWAKTGSGDYGHLWMPLFVHMADSATIAHYVWNWLSQSTKDYLCENMDKDMPEVEGLLSWLAGVHDIGKATPNFQMKVAERADLPRRAGLSFTDALGARGFSHAYMGGIALEGLLLAAGVGKRVAESLASVVSGHHGQNPSKSDLKEVRLEEALDPAGAMGGAQWAEVRSALVQWLSIEVCGFDLLVDGPKDPLTPYAQILASGFVIMCDWLASNTDLFPLVDHVAGVHDFQRRAQVAWERLRMVSHHPFAEPEEICDLFRTRFGSRLPQGAEMLDVQERAAHAAQELCGAGLVLIEAPMGSGKTEASLLAAEILGHMCGSGGICYLLPTMATSDAMFSRVREWMDSLADTGVNVEAQDLHLLHSKAALNEDYRQLEHWGVGWMGDDAGDGESVVCHQWFAGSKRGLLAPSVVGTVDQLLMAALSARHVHLRHLGLSGKVVVIDEVHAYDEYMGVYLKRVLSFLGTYRVPVVLLSATLPPSRREQLMKAYQGLDTRSSSRRVNYPEPPRGADGSLAYPLVSTIGTRGQSGPAYRLCRLDSKSFRVEVRFVDDDNERLATRLEQLLEDGGCACVLKNTVKAAQDTYRVLKERLAVRVVLCHARFAALDRAHIETELRAMLGPSAAGRPEALVVVSTQVIEQSLDVDFDVMVSDMAPIDILLQRTGRLHRHRRGFAECERPERLRQARLYVTGVVDGPVPGFEAGTERVYDRALLMRSVYVLTTLVGGHLAIPDDIATLVERVYDRGDEMLDEVPMPWRDPLARAHRELERKRERRQDSAGQWLLRKPRRGCLTLTGWMQVRLDVLGEQKGRAAVRDGLDSVEVVLLQRGERGLELLPWIAEELQVSGCLGSGLEAVSDEAARAAALSTVPLPYVLCLPDVVEEVLDCLEGVARFCGLRESRWLHDAFFLVLDDSGQAFVKTEKANYMLHYSRDGGLEVW